jgi:hypothetical protein
MGQASENDSVRKLAASAKILLGFNNKAIRLL